MMVTKGIFRRSRLLTFVLLTFVLLTAFLITPSYNSVLAEEKKLIAASSDNSVFISVWREILKEADVDVSFMSARANIRRFWFIENDVQLDCCSIPEWRQRPAELRVQVYTDPMFYSLQFFIHHENANVTYKVPEDLKGYRVAVISGHTHIHEEFFGSTVEAESFPDLFRLIAEGQADIASVNEQEFTFQMAQKNWPIVRGPIFHRLPLRARVRKEHEYLVPRLNAAITRLKESGRMDILIGRAMQSDVN